jgi:hypothetical protein
MKIRKWVMQVEGGRFLSYGKKGRMLLTTNVGKAIMEDTKEDILLYSDKSLKTKPKKLTFKLVDKPTGKPAVYKWVIQATENLGRLNNTINGWYVKGWYANYDKYDNVTFSKAVRKALLYDSREDALCFSYSYVKWKVKKLVFELAE